MVKTVEHILFRTVLVKIILYTVIPHPYSDELTDKKHVELQKDSNSIVGIMDYLL